MVALINIIKALYESPDIILWDVKQHSMTNFNKEYRILCQLLILIHLRVVLTSFNSLAL